MSIKDSLEDYDATIEKANKVLTELESKLSNVSVNISSSSIDVINAIIALFGSSYIRSDGSSTITFDMFKTVTSKLREVGKVKVGEYV